MREQKLYASSNNMLLRALFVLKSHPQN